MRSPIQSGIRWDLPPLPGTPPLIDCMSEGGFPRAITVYGKTAWVYPDRHA